MRWPSRLGEALPSQKQIFSAKQQWSVFRPPYLQGFAFYDRPLTSEEAPPSEMAIRKQSRKLMRKPKARFSVVGGV